MRKDKNLLGILLYALIFLLLIPIGLWFWAKSTDYLIHLPRLQSDIGGFILILLGFMLMLWGWLALMIYGKGLPMNAFPPQLLVIKGPYGIIPHPIYCGFGILTLGAFIYIGSASGLWLVFPVTILGMIAIVLGYEKIDFEERFPGQNYRTLLSLPEDKNEIATLGKRLVVFFQILFYIFLANSVIMFSDFAHYDIFEFSEWTYLNLLYISAVFIVVINLKNQSDLRNVCIKCMISIGIYVFIVLMLPKSNIEYLNYYNTYISSSVNLDNFLNIPIFILLIFAYSVIRYSKIIIGLNSVIILVYVYILFTRTENPIINLLSMMVIFLLSTFYVRIWKVLRLLSENMANSWKEWRFGNLRIINHGFYVGLGAFLGIFLSGFLAGVEYSWAILLFGIIVIIFSALWAQIIEGSEKLKRPYGYYGALIGILFASAAVWLTGFNAWVIIGVVTVVMPWVQALGRLRCLVNGCCHGKPIKSELIGIRYHHFRSRVYNISGLRGKLVHPTPLYSILWLAATGIILLKLWFTNMPIPFIFGMFLILTGIGRFVEEAYRGEVQTKVIRGLRLYQWTALASVIVGIFFTTIEINPIQINAGFNWQTLIAAAIGGLFTLFAMGIDFPNSNARFSRLV